MDPVRLYHLAPSHHCEKARKILDLKAIPYDHVDVPYHDHREVVEESGQDYVPLVVTGDGSAVTFEEIPDWAEQVRPEPTLWPKGASREICRALEQWALVMVEDVLWPYAAPDVPDKLEDDQARWRFVEHQRRKFGDLEMLRETRPHRRGAVEHQLDLAQDLLGSTEFLLGDEPSHADLALYGGTHCLVFSGVGFPNGFDDLVAWRGRVDELGT